VKKFECQDKIVWLAYEESVTGQLSMLFVVKFSHRRRTNNLLETVQTKSIFICIYLGMVSYLEDGIKLMGLSRLRGVGSQKCHIPVPAENSV